MTSTLHSSSPPPKDRHIRLNRHRKPSTPLSPLLTESISSSSSSIQPFPSCLPPTSPSSPQFLTTPAPTPTPARGSMRPQPQRINSATPLLPKQSTLGHDLRCGHWHMPWNMHKHRHGPCAAGNGGGSRRREYRRGCGPKREIKWLGMMLSAGLLAFMMVWGTWTWREKAGPGFGRWNVVPPWEAQPPGITNVTKGVKKLWANSHNDEMQGPNALALALSLGYGYIEVDAHLGPVNPPSHSIFSPLTGQSSPLFHAKDPEEPLDPSLTLLAGHTESDLNARRTVKALYLDPLFEILEAHNRRWNGSETPGKGWVGVYEDDPDEEVVLFVDMKSDGQAMWPYLTSALEPFLSRGYLTTYNTTSGQLTPGPLTVVGTGNTPLARVVYSPLRHIFFDAPLLNLHSPFPLPASRHGPAKSITWHPTLSPVASSKFPLTSYLALGPGQRRGGPNPFMCNLKLVSAIAREKGIQSRWWGVLHQPRFVRERMWDLVWRSGVGVVNADELEELEGWLRKKQEGPRDTDGWGC